MLLLFLISGKSSGQVNIDQSFPVSGTPSGWFAGQGGINQTSACATYSWRINMKSTRLTGELRTPNWTSNGQDVNITFKYKAINWQGANVAANPYDGSIETQLSLNGGTSYPIIAGTVNSSNHVVSNTCATVTYTVPGSSVPNGSNLKLRWFLRWGTTGDHYIYIDDIVITQASGSAPACAALTSPANQAIVSDVSEKLMWDAASGSPTSYDVYFGTSENPPFVENVSILSYSPELDPSTTYYWKIVPKNAFGSATGCTIRSFVTGTTLACNPGSGNDECITAQQIYLGTTESHNACSSNSANVSQPSCNTGQTNYYDTWYKFNTGSTTFVDLSLTAASPVGVGYAVYSGSCGSFAQVSGACNSTGGTTSITGLSKNTVYYIRVYSTTRVKRGIFSINLSVPCTMPTGVMITNTQNSASVNWTASTALPMDGYQYEVRTSGAAGSGNTGLAASGTASGLSKVITGLSENTNYTVYLRSACASASYSSWTTGTSFFTGFCTPAPGSGIGNGITNVTYGDVNNTTSTEPGHYGDYTSLSGTVTRTTQATVNVSLASAYNMKVWVDWNNDLDFNDAGEEVYSSTSEQQDFAAVFTVPALASAGNHRMRIAAGNSSSLTPCYTGATAAFEDYTLNVDTTGPVHLNDAACNSTVSSFTQGLYINNFANAQSYRFRVRNGANEQILTRNAPYITLSMLTSPAYGVTYMIDVAVQLDGEWTDYGKVCNVSAVGDIPLSRLEECTEGGTSVSSFARPIYAQNVQYASVYRFMVTSTQGTYVFDRTVRYFSINMIAGYEYNVNYSVRVATLSGDTWSEYGDACVVRVDMPAPTLMSQYCNGIVTRRGQAIYAANYPGALTYHFRVTVGSTQYLVVRNVGYFFLSQVGTFIPFNTTVGVEVKVYTAGAESAWSASCPVTLTSGTGRPGAGDDNEMPGGETSRLSGFPNPFVETFSIDFMTESEEIVQIVTYDMTGKLVDKREVAANELPALKMGQNFATGIYNLILTQGNTVKTMKIVKTGY
ncbi:MAG: GEVED domain-containing protein [Flavobacterium sp.]